MTLPLASVRILDLSTVLSGPIAAAMLCDQGASVIKVESHEGDTSRMMPSERSTNMCELMGPAFCGA